MSEEKSKVSYLILDVTIQRMEALGKKVHRKPGALIDWLVEEEFIKSGLVDQQPTPTMLPEPATEVVQA